MQGSRSVAHVTELLGAADGTRVRLLCQPEYDATSESWVVVEALGPAEVEPAVLQLVLCDGDVVRLASAVERGVGDSQHFFCFGRVYSTQHGKRGRGGGAVLSASLELQVDLLVDVFLDPERWRRAVALLHHAVDACP